MTESARIPFDDPEFRSHLRGAKRGDDSSWEALYRWLAPQVLGFLRSARLCDPEDVLGDVFLDVARQIGTFRGDASGFRAWVFTIARARRVDEIRRRMRRQADPFDTAEHDRLLSHSDVEVEAIASLVVDDLMVRLQVLTEDQIEVIVLRTIGDLTSREIAEITGRTVGAVEQLQHRGLRALRGTFDGA